MRAFLLIFLLIPLVIADTPYWWYDRTNTLPNRQTMVHLFEWKWTDIANECENFLQHNGYGAVQISPPMEHITLTVNNDLPWWVRYQPVSYKLQSRSGTEAELQDMVNRCNKVGVRIIADVVMNHMVGVGQKKGDGGRGSSGNSEFNGNDGVESFPGVPYSSSDFDDFKCHGDIQGSDYQNNAANVKNCRLVGLLDLNQGSATVRNELVGWLNKLISMGVAGFRCDASKHMWPADLETIFNSTTNLRADIFGSNARPFIVHEVIDRGGEAVKCTDYVNIGRYTNFNFGAAVSSAARKDSNFKYLAFLGPGYGYGNNEDHDVLNFIDNHDNQRDSNPYVVTYKNGKQYEIAVAFMLAWPYGYPRVMSSYFFTASDQGPPNNGAAKGYETKSPTFNSDETCKPSSGWICEHRWPSIRRMAQFRSVVQGSAAAEITTDSNRIAFGRDGKGFFALNNDDSNWNKVFQTTLPSGQYCDQYNGSLLGQSCTGAMVTVGNDGKAQVNVPSNSVVTISLASRIGGPPPSPPLSSGFSKTVVFIKKDTEIGQDLFIRGGVNHASNGQTHQCSPGPMQQPIDPCAIPIVHNTTTPDFYTEYRMWSQGDQYLDFEGVEQRQGTHDGSPAWGTPLAYSTNNPNAVEYNKYNKYGEGYWVVEVLMDCTKTENGWFELKGYLTNSVGWENNVNQGTCSGSVGGSAPFKSINHIAKCGSVSVFKWDDNSCIVDPIV